MMTRPLIGLGVVAIRHGRILVEHRIGPHGYNQWAPPGGHLEMWETAADGARRELLEETGLYAVNPTFLTMTDDLFPGSGVHYVTLWFATEVTGEAQVREPDRCAELRWVHPDEVPQPWFGSWGQFISSPVGRELVSDINGYSVREFL